MKIPFHLQVCTQLFYKYLFMLFNFNMYVYKMTMLFGILLNMCCLMVIPSGLQHVAILCVIIWYKVRKENSVHFIGWVFWSGHKWTEAIRGEGNVHWKQYYNKRYQKFLEFLKESHKIKFPSCSAYLNGRCDTKGMTDKNWNK